MRFSKRKKKKFTILIVLAVGVVVAWKTGLLEKAKNLVFKTETPSIEPPTDIEVNL